jgi:hypothetical protein
MKTLVNPGRIYKMNVSEERTFEEYCGPAIPIQECHEDGRPIVVHRLGVDDISPRIAMDLEGNKYISLLVMLSNPSTNSIN